MSEPPGPPPLRAPASFRGIALRLALALLSFAAIDLGLGLVLDRARLRCAAGESGVINNARLARPDILILGSSRAKHHYDDETLSRLWGARVFNTGQGGQGLPFSRIVFEQTLRQTKPKAVIIDVMHFDEGMRRVHALDPWWPDSPILRALPADATADTEAAAWKNDLLMRIHAYRYAGSAWATLKDARKKPRPYGFGPLPVTDRMVNEAMAVQPKQSQWLIPQLDALVREAKQAGCTVILAFSPMKSGNCDEAIIAPVATYAKAQNLPFLLFNAHSHPDLHDPAFFRDAWHMNHRGAARFTEVFASSAAPLLPLTTKEP